MTAGRNDPYPCWSGAQYSDDRRKKGPAPVQGAMSMHLHSAATLLQAMLAWLRFLEPWALIVAGVRDKVLAKLRTVHASLLPFGQRCAEDAHRLRQA